MRLATDFQIALLVGTAIWAVWYFGRVFLDAIFDPYGDRFEDVDELLESER